MPTVGAGVHEIRVHTGVEHRILYIAKFAEAVYVLHASEKRARKTHRHDLEVARQRLRLLMIERAKRGR
jgi:phage-related protein